MHVFLVPIEQIIMSLEIEFIVEGMSCGRCESAITKALGAVEGVTSVVANRHTARVLVTLSKAQPALKEALALRIEDEGFDVVQK